MCIASIPDLWLSIKDRDHARLAEMMRAIHDQDERNREDRARFRDEEPTVRNAVSFFDDASGLPTRGEL